LFQLASAKGIVDAANSGSLNIYGFVEMNDNEIIKTLTAFTGVGIWTAEMLFIFSLMRPDISS